MCAAVSQDVMWCIFSGPQAQHCKWWYASDNAAVTLTPELKYKSLQEWGLVNTENSDAETWGLLWLSWQNFLITQGIKKSFQLQVTFSVAKYLKTTDP